MPTVLDLLFAQFARLHAGHVYRRFEQSLGRVEQEQRHAMNRALRLVAESNFGRRHSLRSVRTPGELRRAVPLLTYEDVRPYLERVWEGDTGALFAPRQRILMFATSSGTTAKPKHIPVTPAFVRDYRRGWNTFGLKMLTDHPAAVLRAILQSSGRYDVGYSPGGIAHGAITGLLARMQKRIVRRYYVGRPEVANLPDARARYYALMRLGITRDVAFAITANPSTLIQMARVAADESETLVRDVHDGTLSASLVPDENLRRLLSRRLKPNSRRAAELGRLRTAQGVLRPRDYWDLTFLACWTGGSMGLYLDRLREWYGPLPIRDVGLLASEGRVSIPLEDGTPAGVLDVQSGLFEFIPVEHVHASQPQTLWLSQLESGREYAVVLTNTSGLMRYRLDDVVRVCGRVADTPVVEFLYRAGGVASVAGEKLTENQAVAAVQTACRELGLQPLDFILAPCWADPPYYRLSCDAPRASALAEAVDAALCKQNEEYESRRKSLRLQALEVRYLPPGTILAMDRHLAGKRGGSAEQYKRTCLFTRPGDDDAAINSALH